MRKAIVKKNRTHVYFAVLFAVLISVSIGFYFGTIYKDKNEARISSASKNTGTAEDQNERKRLLVKKCGDIPREKLEIKAGQFVGIDGPEWSPDCRHIAYSLFSSGTVAINEDGAATSVKGNADEGIYVYDVDTEKIKKIQL